MHETQLSQEQTMLQPLLAEMVKAVVDDPEAVRIESIREADSTMLRLYVAPADLGKVIGKQGNTARSMRTILLAASKKLQHPHVLDIVKVDQPS